MPKGYSQEIKDKALRLAQIRFEEGDYQSKQAVASKLSVMLGISDKTLLKWFREAGIPKTLETEISYAQQAAELKKLRRENEELRRANEILKLASAFFAKELDQPER